MLISNNLRFNPSALLKLWREMKMDAMKKMQALMFVMANPAMLPVLANGINTQKSVENRFDGVGGLIGGIVVAIIAIVIYSQMGGSIMPSSITTLSNTSAIAGYSTWSSATQNMWTNIPTITTLAFWIIPLVIIMALIKYIT